MSLHGRSLLRGGVALGVVAFAAVGVAVAWPWLEGQWAARASHEVVQDSAGPAAQIDAADPNSLRLAASVPEKLGLRTAGVEYPSRLVTLEMSGTLILDSTRLSHVHARFVGEVVQIGDEAEGRDRIDVGESVRKGQLLAILWSRELGEKKSELVDSLSQLRVDQETYDRLAASASAGAIPDRTLRDSERKLDSDRIAAERVVRTLETWRVAKEEIDSLRAEADRVAKGRGKTRAEMVREWAKVEIRSPLDGIVLERNVARGDLVDTTLDLFKVADLTRLCVVAYAYEEDLPVLDSLPDNQRRWAVRLGSEPEAETRVGRFDRIGRIIDPNQHTALVMGWVDNPGGRLRVGQFITATVEFAPPRDEVTVPATAIVEQGDRQYVFIQPDPHQCRYVRRPVAVMRRSPLAVNVRSDPKPAERQRGAEPIRVGELVVCSGAVQLMGTLANLQASVASR